MRLVAEREQLPVQQARTGSPDAWEIIFQRYQLPLYVYVFQLLHREQASLDVVQEAFISATRHLKSLREDDKLGSWLFGIAHQKVLLLWRRESREARLFAATEVAPLDFEEGPDELLIREEQELAFMKLLDQLPVPQRSVLLLHFVEDFSLLEIAAITETALGTVKSRLHYGKRALRQLLQDKL